MLTHHQLGALDAKQVEPITRLGSHICTTVRGAGASWSLIHVIIYHVRAMRARNGRGYPQDDCNIAQRFCGPAEVVRVTDSTGRMGTTFLAILAKTLPEAPARSHHQSNLTLALMEVERPERYAARTGICARRLHRHYDPKTKFEFPRKRNIFKKRKKHLTSHARLT